MENLSPLLKETVAPVCRWYEAHRIPLPWRDNPTPYAVWISEIMLQQTRIEAALPYYRRFMEALPTVEALAAVDGEALLKLWQGLGYYSRAKNLKKAAILLTVKYGGNLPEEAKELKTLPGIGDYTAGAIASIAYGKPEPAVDGNVLRVVTRLAACREDVMRMSVRGEVTRALREVYPSGKEAARYTEGLMELGERVCLPNAAPLCEECPLRGLCKAFAAGETLAYPVRGGKKARRVEERSVFLLRYKGKYAIQKRPPSGLLADTWELPNCLGWEPTDAPFLADCGIGPEDLRPCGEGKHLFSHIEWRMKGFFAECRKAAEDFVWVTEGQIREKYAIPSAFAAFLSKIK